MNINDEWMLIPEWLMPLGILVVSFLVGWVIEKGIFSRLKRFAAQTPWILDDLIVDSLDRLPMLWTLLLGSNFALLHTQLNAAAMAHGQKALLILFLVSLVFLLARMTGNLVIYFSKRMETVQHATSILVNLAKLVIFVLGALVVLQTMGVSILPVLTALGVGGLAVSLALQDTLSNLFAGIQILLTKQFRPGDFIRLSSGEEGTVIDINWRNTSIRQQSNNVIIVPNAKLASTIITNFHTSDPVLSVPVELSISYENNLEHVESLIKGVADEVMISVVGGVPEFDAVVRFHTFSDSGIHLTVILRAQDFLCQFAIKHAFLKRIKERFEAEGIVFSSAPKTVQVALLERPYNAELVASLLAPHHDAR